MVVVGHGNSLVMSVEHLPRLSVVTYVHDEVHQVDKGGDVGVECHRVLWEIHYTAGANFRQDYNH